MHYEDETASEEGDPHSGEWSRISVKGRRTNLDERERKGTCDRRKFIDEPIAEELLISISRFLIFDNEFLCGIILYTASFKIFI